MRFVDENGVILKTPFCSGGVYDFYGESGVKEDGSGSAWWFAFPSQMIAELNQSTISWMNNYPCKFWPLKLDCIELVTNRDGQCLCWKKTVVNYQIVTALIVALLIVVLVIYGFMKCTDIQSIWSSKTLLNRIWKACIMLVISFSLCRLQSKLPFVLSNSCTMYNELQSSSDFQ